MTKPRRHARWRRSDGSGETRRGGFETDGVYFWSLGADLNLLTKRSLGPPNTLTSHYCPPPSERGHGLGATETPWLQSVTPPNSTMSPQRWLFNKLLAGGAHGGGDHPLQRPNEETKRSLLLPGVGGEVGGAIHSDYTQSPFVAEDF